MAERDFRKSTVVSIVPFEIRERKVTIVPPDYIIPASVNLEPQALVISDAKTYVYMDADRGHIERPVFAKEIADSVVNDYIRASLCSEEGCHPGLFSLDGNYTVQEVKTVHKEKLDVAKQAQMNWFVALVNLADRDWKKYNGNPLVISELQRFAGEWLKVDKPWMLKLPTEANTCPICFSIIDTRAAICSNCRFILKPDVVEKNKGRFVEV